MTNVLFVTWDGPGQWYLEALFLPIFARLARAGFRVHVLQFTWASDDEVRATREAARGLGVLYERRRVLRRPAAPATAGMVLAGAWEIARYARKHGVDIVMPRSIVPAAMCLLAQRSARWGLVYDADGLSADERVDFAGWSAHGLQYRAFRDVEAEVLRRATSVVTRTSRAKDVLVARAGAGTNAGKIHVVPNGKDGGLFSPGGEQDRLRTRVELDVPPDATLLVFAGSIGPQYHPQEMLAFAQRVRARASDTRLVFLTSQVNEVRALAASIPDAAGWIDVRTLPPTRVPAVLAAADVGVSFRAPSFSQRAVCPIKVAEYLLCGLAVVATPVGDLAEQLTSDVACVIRDLSTDELERASSFAASEVRSDRAGFRARARAVGERHFELERCARGYADVLASSVR